MQEKKGEFERLIVQLTPEDLKDALMYARYLVARQQGKWLTPLEEIHAILEMLTRANVKQVRDFARDVFYKQLQLQGPPKMDFEKRKKRPS